MSQNIFLPSESRLEVWSSLFGIVEVLSAWFCTYDAGGSITMVADRFCKDVSDSVVDASSSSRLLLCSSNAHSMDARPAIFGADQEMGFSTFNF